MTICRDSGSREGSRITSSCSFLISVLATRLCRTSCARQRVPARIADVHEMPPAGQLGLDLDRLVLVGLRARQGVRYRGGKDIETNHMPPRRCKRSHDSTRKTIDLPELVSVSSWRVHPAKCRSSMGSCSVSLPQLRSLPLAIPQPGYQTRMCCFYLYCSGRLVFSFGRSCSI